MIGAASLGESLKVIVENIFLGFANVAFTGSLILSFIMAGAVVLYSKRRPANAYLSWGEAMAAAVFVSFALFWAFGVVPHQWLTYAQGEFNMRSDAILAGPGSTGLAEWSPVMISKQTVAELGYRGPLRHVLHRHPHAVGRVAKAWFQDQRRSGDLHLRPSPREVLTHG